MPSIAGSVGIAGQSMCHPSSREMRFDMAATNRITPIDESEVAVNESAGSERSEPTRSFRRHLPDERRALTHHFSIAGQEGYLTVGGYEDGLPGEKFITGDQGELFKALPMSIQPARDANVTDPVGALGELILMGDAPACNICGSLMVRSGTCYRCGTCGATSGCS